MRNFILLIITLVLLLGPATFSQQRRHDQEVPDELWELVKKRADLINEDLSKSRDEWAGTYYAGDHHPIAFMWSHENGFVVTSSLHTFAPSWVNYGRVKMDGLVFTIFPELPDRHQFVHVMPTRFQAVRWDQQHFLIPVDELMDFAYAVHSRAESQIVDYFAKGRYSQKSRRGFPQLPAMYHAYLKMAPIVTKIVAVSGDKDWPIITIAAGTKQRIREGMLFYYKSRMGFQLSVRVTKASLNSSEAEVYGTGSTGETDTNDERIRPGWRLTSRIPKGFIEPG